MFVRLNGEALEAALINVARPRSVVVGVVAHGVRGRDPAEKLAHLAIPVRPQHQVPMVGHELVAEQLDFVPFQPFGQNSLEGREVFLLVKYRGPAIAPVQGMVESSRFVGTWWSGHESESITERKTKQ